MTAKAGDRVAGYHNSILHRSAGTRCNPLSDQEKTGRDNERVDGVVEACRIAALDWSSRTRV
jgi:hypothetical protein